MLNWLGDGRQRVLSISCSATCATVGNTAVKFKFITTYKLVVTLKFNPQFDYHTPLRRLVSTFDETPLIKSDCLSGYASLDFTRRVAIIQYGRLLYRRLSSVATCRTPRLVLLMQSHSCTRASSIIYRTVDLYFKGTVFVADLII